MKQLLVFLLALIILPISDNLFAQSIADKVTIRRTDYGVPHIMANDFKSVAFGLAYAECEDRGEKVIIPLIKARGIFAKFNTKEDIDRDMYAKLTQSLTRNTYHLLSQDTRDILDGFAEGVNYYLQNHPDKFPAWFYREYNGIDVATVSNFSSHPSSRSASDFLKVLAEKKKNSLANDDVGSNAWALAPERTKSGSAILMRNPHLSWEAGYYEAHITVPGKVNFYGDFRIGGMFSIICGFNDHLGWSTTNNHPDLEEVYALKVDPSQPDHYLLDGGSFPVSRKLVEVEFKNGEGSGIVTKEWLYTPFGPVIHREDGFIYIVKTADWNNFQRGEQLMSMLKSKNLDEWKSAMKNRHISSSNYTYADAEGNIFYIWNASTPKLPHVFQGDTVAHIANSVNDIWTVVQDFYKIPQLLNPQGGYLQNSNDPFYLTNLHQPIPADGQPDNYPEPDLRVRSQHSISLLDNEKQFSLEEVVAMKYSMKMLAADRLKPDLITIINSNNPDSEYQEVAQYLNNWDNTSARESQGSVLFNEWFWNYRSLVGNDNIYKTAWNWDQPTTTPIGINNADSAYKALVMAVDSLKLNYNSYKMAWGDMYRVRRGDVDVPVGGGSGTVGNFRVLYFNDDEDGKKSAVGGDGWVFAVEFGKKIKAYSILAYGQSNDSENSHFADQAALFADNKMKKVAFSEKEIKKALKKEYKPGEEK